MESIQSLRMASAGFGVPQGYAGHPDFDLEIPEDNTGSTELPDYNREPFDEYNFNELDNEGDEDHIWDDLKEEHKASFLDFHQYPFIEIPIWAKRTTVRGPQGRLFSESCFMMIASKSGFIGYGYGMAATAQNAAERAKAEAIRNIRSVRFSSGRIIQDEVRAHHRGTTMILTPRKKGVRAHPLFKGIMMHFLHLDGVALKIHGSKNPLRLIPLFFKLMDRVMTMEQRTLGRGIIPLYAGNKYGDYMENVRKNRGQFGWY
jgi:ribosomal protein S5